MSENVTKKMLTEVKEYLRLRKELIKTEAVIKVSKLTTSIILTIIGVISLSISLSFFVFSIALYLSSYIGYIYAFCIGGLIFILILIMIYLFKKKLILNPIAKFINKLIHS
jgi:hypothetical protein